MFSPAKRTHIDNGIGLCSNCATLIDKDEAKFYCSLMGTMEKGSIKKSGSINLEKQTGAAW